MNFFRITDFLPQGVSVSHEGMSPGWAILLLVVAIPLTIAGYRWAGAALSSSRRTLLIALRLIFLTGLTILLVKPILVLSTSQLLRQTLIVLVDDSQSMLTKDRRSSHADAVRAAIASGASSPGTSVTPAMARQMEGTPTETTRLDLLQSLTANRRMNLFSRLMEKADLVVYRFSRDASEIGRLAPVSGRGLDAAALKAFFEPVKGTGTATSIGDAVRETLELNRENPLAGIFLISDGGSNVGQPVADAAAMAGDARVPIFAYGVGVTDPPDFIVKSLDVPPLAFLKESAVIRVHYVPQALPPGSTGLTFRVNGEEKGRKTIQWKDTREADAEFEYKPEKPGDFEVSVEASSVQGEISLENNSAKATLHVLDTRIKVLFIEQQPRWDYRYLLAVLQADPRFDLKVVLLDGDKILQTLPNTPFLPGLPGDPKYYDQQDIVILGDVDPKRLPGDTMKWLANYVDKIGGGLIFLAGTQHNPFDYRGTPLEPLLPIIPPTQIAPAERRALFATPQKFRLTVDGQRSSWLRLSQDEQENLGIWDSFTGVQWAAATMGPRLGTEVDLEEISREHLVNGKPNPVLAHHHYGKGECAYIGTDETYRWRSRIGGKYYIKVWGQILQGLALERLLGASYRTQLVPSKQEYQVGETVSISGRIYTTEFTPVTADSMPADLKIKPADETEGVQHSDVSIKALPGHPGEFKYEFTSRMAGIYELTTKDDPTAPVRFTVVNPNLEKVETSLNVDAMRALADGSHGKFLREEDLNSLPDLIKMHKSDAPQVSRIDIFNSPWLLLFLIVVGCLEWFIRRRSDLK